MSTYNRSPREWDLSLSPSLALLSCRPSLLSLTEYDVWMHELLLVISCARHGHHHPHEREYARARAHIVQIPPSHQHALHPRRSPRPTQLRIDQLVVQREHFHGTERRDREHDAATEEPQTRHPASARAVSLQIMHDECADTTAESHGTLHPRGVEVHPSEERRLERHLVGLQQRRVLRDRNKRGGACEDAREPRRCDFRERFDGHDAPHLCGTGALEEEEEG